MAGIETVHRIVEKIEVAGAKQAANAFDRLGGLAGLAAKALGLTSSSSDRAAKGLNSASAAASKMGDGAGNASDGMNDMAKSVFKGTLAANLVAKAFSYVVNKAEQLVRHGIAVNHLYEGITDTFTGLIYTLTDFDKMKIKDPAQRFGMAQKGAEAMMGEIEAISLKVAEPIQNIVSLSKQVEPIWASLGKSQYEVARMTEDTAAASKVMGVSSERVWSVSQRILMTGRANKRDAISQLVYQKAQIKASDSAAVKASKLQKALHEIGAPIDKITKGTGDAMMRWEILTNSVLRSATKPIFDKIGEVIAKIVDWTLKHREVVDSVVVACHALFDVLWRMSATVVEGAVALGKWLSGFDSISAAVGTVVDSGTVLWEVVDLIASSWDVVAESIRVLNGGPMTRLNVLTDLFWLKMTKVLRTIAKIAEKLESVASLPGDIFGPKITPEMEKAIKAKNPYYVTKAEMAERSMVGSLDRYIKHEDARIAELEKKLGMDPTTDAGRRAKAHGMTEEERKRILAGLAGKVTPIFQQNIDKIEIRQDFRDQDPDRVMVEFTRSLERLGENALQSTVGGMATAYGPGSS